MHPSMHALTHNYAHVRVDNRMHSHNYSRMGEHAANIHTSMREDTPIHKQDKIYIHTQVGITDPHHTKR